MQKYYLFSNQQSFKHKITYSHPYTCKVGDSLHDACHKKRCLHLYLVLNDGILFCILLLMAVLNNTFMSRFTTAPSLFNNHPQSI